MSNLYTKIIFPSPLPQKRKLQGMEVTVVFIDYQNISSLKISLTSALHDTFWIWEINFFFFTISCSQVLPFFPWLQWKRHEKNRMMKKRYFPVLSPWSSGWGINIRMRDCEVQFICCGTSLLPCDTQAHLFEATNSNI